jgi:hypothetical protein
MRRLAGRSGYLRVIRGFAVRLDQSSLSGSESGSSSASGFGLTIIARDLRCEAHSWLAPIPIQGLVDYRSEEFASPCCSSGLVDFPDQAAADTNHARDATDSILRYVSDSTRPRKTSIPDARQAARLSAANNPKTVLNIDTLPESNLVSRLQADAGFRR